MTNNQRQEDIKWLAENVLIKDYDPDVDRWNPYESIADAWMLVEKVEDKINVLCITPDKGGTAIVSAFNDKEKLTVKDKPAPTAISEAILKALRGENE